MVIDRASVHTAMRSLMDRTSLSVRVFVVFRSSISMIGEEDIISSIFIMGMGACKGTVIRIRLIISFARMAGFGRIGLFVIVISVTREGFWLIRVLCICTLLKYINDVYNQMQEEGSSSIYALNFLMTPGNCFLEKLSRHTEHVLASKLFKSCSRLNNDSECGPHLVRAFSKFGR